MMTNNIVHVRGGGGVSERILSPTGHFVQDIVLGNTMLNDVT